MEESGESGNLHSPAGHAEAPGRQRRVFISYASHDAPEAASVLGATLGWIWMVIAGGGGLLMLIRQGPWPLTNAFREKSLRGLSSVIANQ